MKKADHITILDGADGPTSVFFLEKPHDGRRSLKQKWEKYLTSQNNGNIMDTVNFTEVKHVL